MLPLPISIEDVRAAQARIKPYVPTSPTYQYPLLDAWVGHGVNVFVKHENFNPTGSFKVRNGIAFASALNEAQRQRGVVAATRGNHGLGIAYAGRLFRVPTTICVPMGNNPEKNAGIVALGARLIEAGHDYDASLVVAQQIIDREGAVLAHSTNNRHIIAGAATLSLELHEQVDALDAMVVSVGGGSQAVGAITVARALRPTLQLFGVQAAGAPAGHDSFHAKTRLTTERASTIADGLATRSTYDLTFPALQTGLHDFITVTDTEIADAVRTLLSTTHTLVEAAGAAGLAGLKKLAPRLAGKRVAIVLSGGNIDRATLAAIVNGQL